MTSSASQLVFLKLGGSLITEKTKPHTPRPHVITRLAGEIAAACSTDPGLRLVLGHGSGSYGHIPAQRYHTRQGVRTPQEWTGFVEVWREATALNRLVMDALAAAGLPALPFPPSAGLLARAGRVLEWGLSPLKSALASGLLPVVFGDVVFDQQLGGTIFSTEDLFAYLAEHLHPQRILLAGLEAGVWADFPACTRLLAEILPGDLQTLSDGIGGSAATDVTGGMLGKVRQSLDLVQRIPGLEIRIYSGLQPDAVQRSLLGEPVGTLIRDG